MEPETRELMRASLRELVSSASGVELLAALDETGWFELLAGEPADAVGLLFEEQGRAVATSRALDAVVMDALGRPFDAGSAFVYPRPAGREAAAVSGGELEIDGIALVGSRDAKSLALILHKPDEPRDHAVATLARETAGLATTPVSGLDADCGWIRVRGRVAREAAEIDAGAGALRSAAALAAARRALAHELVGLGEAMLAIGVAHVTERRQFGRAIGTFQTVKHRLADVQVDLTASRLALAVAWHSIREGSETETLASRVAKARAGRAALLAARHVQQVCGAIGWTWEHGLHRFIRRTHMLDALLGSGHSIQRELGEMILATRTVPRLGVL